MHGALISIFTLMLILIALPGGLDVLIYIHLQSAPRRDGGGRTSKRHTKKSGSTTCPPQRVVGGVRFSRRHRDVADDTGSFEKTKRSATHHTFWFLAPFSERCRLQQRLPCAAPLRRKIIDSISRRVAK